MTALETAAPGLQVLSVTVDLPPEALRRLEAEASRRGISIDEVIAQLVAKLPVDSSAARRRPAFVAIGASEQGITDRMNDTLAKGFGRD
jgi:hypothetical protein